MQTRPHIFTSEEVPAAIHEVFSNPSLIHGMRTYLPESVCQQILQQTNDIKTIYDFQKNIISSLVSLIEHKSTASLTLSGLEHLQPQKRYLFISNHRDIVLDSAFINNSLFKRGFSTAQIAIGDNLMKHRLSELIFKLNKSFVVKRSGSPTELYHYSVGLSAYIHAQIANDIDSVWLAQREGRAKDGNDMTQVGLLKMLSLSNTDGDLKSYFKQLQIIPTSISYEYNPCDHLITQEYINRLADPAYKKSFKEDMEHILCGLWGPKGRVHIHFGKQLEEELDIFDTETNSKKQLTLLRDMLDHAIQHHYQLRPINYVALHLLGEDALSADKYTAEELAHYSAYFEQKRKLLHNDVSGAGYEYLLTMYANPAKAVLGIPQQG